MDDALRVFMAWIREGARLETDGIDAAVHPVHGLLAPPGRAAGPARAAAPLHDLLRRIALTKVDGHGADLAGFFQPRGDVVHDVDLARPAQVQRGAGGQQANAASAENQNPSARPRL